MKLHHLLRNKYISVHVYKMLIMKGIKVNIKNNRSSSDDLNLDVYCQSHNVELRQVLVGDRPSLKSYKQKKFEK